ncbi:hypothetical protein [Enterococcus alishanensis]|uniref:DUF1189 domain-containing protein n=1 Tax=Enterococcus alishanensis TaxID=1303817 RepID=A0ABS6TDX9_9ENTE|nr:hypothetical protein [Enterococcus alishanensis]MBV7391105.1 hypothetical protein [Enterococcus alishanensis]
MLFLVDILFISCFFILAHLYSERADENHFIKINNSELWLLRIFTIVYLISISSSVGSIIKVFISFPFPNLDFSSFDSLRFYQIIIEFLPFVILFGFIMIISFIIVYVAYMTFFVWFYANKKHLKIKLMSKKFIMFWLAISIMTFVLISPFEVVKLIRDIFTILIAASLFKIINKKDKKV